jgi:hypothetical protein
MTQRRSLTTALEITPQKLEFIRGTESLSNSQLPEPHVTEPQQAAASPRKRNPVQQSKPRAELADATHAEPSLLGVLLVPLTTRLQPKTADALKRAYLEQKLKGRIPATQQEIIEAALQGWLRKEGYL